MPAEVVGAQAEAINEEAPTKMQKIEGIPRMAMRVKKLSETAVLPVRGSVKAAGYDLASAHAYTVPARGKELCKTDIAISIPDDCYGRVAPRSGLTWKNGLDVGAGVIDADYTGNIGVILFNHTDTDFKVEPGMRIAQLILEKIYMLDVEEVEDLDATERGAGGFGSTGVQSK